MEEKRKYPRIRHREEIAMVYYSDDRFTVIDAKVVDISMRGIRADVLFIDSLCLPVGSRVDFICGRSALGGCVVRSAIDKYSSADRATLGIHLDEYYSGKSEWESLFRQINQGGV